MGGLSEECLKVDVVLQSGLEARVIVPRQPANNFIDLGLRSAFLLSLVHITRVHLIEAHGIDFLGCSSILIPTMSDQL